VSSCRPTPPVAAMMVSFMVFSSQTVYRLNMKEWLQVAMSFFWVLRPRRWTCAA
jgi:hypothetical protein